MMYVSCLQLVWGAELTVGCIQTSRENMIAEFQRLTDEKAQLQKELAMNADNDPMEVERQHKLLKLYKEAINIYVGQSLPWCTFDEH